MWREISRIITITEARKRQPEESAKPTSREMEQNKHVPSRGSGNEAENLLQLNFTPAKKMRSEQARWRGENEYELRS
jgi:hypothetical protein